MLRFAILSTLLAGLAGCGLPANPPGEPETAARRVLADTLQKRAFVAGPVSIVTSLDTYGSTRAMSAYTVTPCRNMTFVCADDPHGRVGTAVQDPDFTVISGTHPGLTFYLSPGGDGFVGTASGFVPLSWE